MDDGTMDPGQISICPAGCVRLQFGMAMVHLPAEEFRSFVRLAGNALAAIDRCGGGVPAAATRVAH